MGQRSPMLKAREIVRALHKLGFIQTRQKGSHAIFTHPDGRVTSVPRHGGEDIGRGLLGEILVQINISQEELHKIL